MIQNIITTLSVIISLSTLFTFIRNELHKQREYGKFLHEIETALTEISGLKRTLRKIDHRHKQWIIPIEKEIAVLKEDIHKQDKLTSELFIRLDSIISSLEEVKTRLKNKE
jgi:predicted  nucleic acid-binding Zn-ribbon protein